MTEIAVEIIMAMAGAFGKIIENQRGINQKVTGLNNNISENISKQFV